MIFVVDNVQIITSETNRQQLDQKGFIWQQQFIDTIGIERFKELEIMAEDKSLKNTLMSGEEYQKIFDDFRSLNKEKEKELAL